MLSEEVLTLDLVIKEVLNAIWRHVAILHSCSKKVAIERFNIFDEASEKER